MIVLYVQKDHTSERIANHHRAHARHEYSDGFGAVRHGIGL